MENHPSRIRSLSHLEVETSVSYRILACSSNKPDKSRSWDIAINWNAFMKLDELGILFSASGSYSRRIIFSQKSDHLFIFVGSCPAFCFCNLPRPTRKRHELHRRILSHQIRRHERGHTPSETTDPQLSPVPLSSANQELEHVRLFPVFKNANEIDMAHTVLGFGSRILDIMFLWPSVNHVGKVYSAL